MVFTCFRLTNTFYKSLLSFYQCWKPTPPTLQCNQDLASEVLHSLFGLLSARLDVSFACCSSGVKIKCESSQGSVQNPLLCYNHTYFLSWFCLIHNIKQGSLIFKYMQAHSNTGAFLRLELQSLFHLGNGDLFKKPCSLSIRG